MKKLGTLITLLVLFAVPALAQDSGSGPTFELGAGYTFRAFDFPYSGPRLKMNGFNVNGDFNLMKWVGVAAEFNDTSYSGIFGNNRVYTYEAGPRVYPFGHHRFTPFGQALFGAGHFGSQLLPDYETQFAWSVGVGVDYSLKHHFALRLGPVSYEKTRFLQGTAFGPNPDQANLVADAGIVFRF
ncbi:MAG: outer membrane beta-barrel protein [Candidatus Acidiferrales bacterium]